ncbi:MAG: hypothetical protein C5B51_01235 [Terriglobia bacterium]|nr:MAG: hypothetical protein C5B51_01235 [Terriglobia bacterium]
MPGSSSKEEIEELRRTLARTQTDLAELSASMMGRFEQVEERLHEHAAKLADIPSTSQIVGAMEQLLAKAMSSLDERLSAQAQSIDVLKTTVLQTDILLERVLESLDSLQPVSDSAVAAGE